MVISPSLVTPSTYRTDISPGGRSLRVDERVSGGKRRLAAEVTLLILVLFVYDSTAVLKLSSSVFHRLVHINPLRPVSGTSGLSRRHSVL